MFTHPATEPPEARTLPLGFPANLWAQMTPEHRQACYAAQALLGGFGTERSLPLKEASARAGIGLSQALEGLSVLDGMSLVEIEASATGPRVTLLAIPDEHVRIIGPDGLERWVFVARPLDPPLIDPKELN